MKSFCQFILLVPSLNVLTLTRNYQQVRRLFCSIKERDSSLWALCVLLVSPAGGGRELFESFYDSELHI